MNAITEEATKAGYNFSPMKCEGVHMKTRSRDHTTPKLNGTPVPQRDNISWLGYWLSKDWKWNTPMENWRAKAEKSERAIQALTEWYQIGGLNAWCTHQLIKFYSSGNSLHNYARDICHHGGEHISESKFPE